MGHFVVCADEVGGGRAEVRHDNRFYPLPVVIISEVCVRENGGWRSRERKSKIFCRRPLHLERDRERSQRQPLGCHFFVLAPTG